jgi:hypothetical protein
MNVNDKNFIDNFLKNNWATNRDENHIDLSRIDKFTKLPIFIQKNQTQTQESCKFNAEDLNLQLKAFEKSPAAPCPRQEESEEAILNEFQGKGKIRKLAPAAKNYDRLVNEFVQEDKNIEQKKLADERAYDVNVNKTILGGEFKSLYQDTLSKEDAESELKLMEEGTAYLHDDNGNETFVISMKSGGLIKHITLDFENVKTMIEGMQNAGIMFIQTEENKSLTEDDEYLEILERNLNYFEDKKTERVKDQYVIEKLSVKSEEIDPLDDLLGSFQTEKQPVKNLNGLKAHLKNRREELANNPKADLEIDEDLENFHQKLDEIKSHNVKDLKNLRNKLIAKRDHLEVNFEQDPELDAFNAKRAEKKASRAAVKREANAEEIAFKKFLVDLGNRGEFLSRMDRTNDTRVKQNAPLFAKWKGQNNKKILESKPYFHGEMSIAQAELQIKNQPLSSIITYFDVEKQNIAFTYRNNNSEIVHAPMPRAFKGFEMEDLVKSFQKAGYTFIYKTKSPLHQVVDHAPKKAHNDILPKMVNSADMAEAAKAKVEEAKVNVNNFSYFGAFISKIIAMVKLAYHVVPRIQNVKFYVYMPASKAKSVWKSTFSC